jgi:hypothetical protein
VCIRDGDGLEDRFWRPLATTTTTTTTTIIE